MKALAIVVVLAGTAHADPADDIRDKVAAVLPPGLGVAHVYVPSTLTKVDSVELPGEFHIGRPSVKVLSHGRTVWVPVAIGPVAEVAVATHTLTNGDVITDADISIESRAIEGFAPAPSGSLVGSTVVHAIATGSTIAGKDVTLPPPLPRGSQVAIELHRGSVVVKGTGVLELPARPGQAASVRLAFNKTVVHGMLRAPATVVVGDSP
ncbi:MAG TPA: flagellar basal body P-ring formation chaperone FlgA [Kofleriaceae bacterium]|jgi:flagella basal body P-ring formation protein FlgA|nr:flagellar basal body P-ring formation chaperone FlgA [Kofleriaceae bacterium]